ncbi:MAG: dicarboxylate/amino acid:cation symporter, partial [Gallicola sp.]|nr:dicarboxylate/amino acid:cation symporter [Gallicola sp.]
MTKKIQLGLVPRLILAIIFGIAIGQMKFIPEVVIRVLVTFSSLFSVFLNFVIPLMIIGFIVKGIADLTDGAGKLLGVTALTAYGSTIIAGSIAYIVASNFFPTFITDELVQKISQTGEGLQAIFTIPLEPMLDVTAAIVFAFMMGLGISWLKGQGKGQALYEVFDDFGEIIIKVLNKVI